MTIQEAMLAAVVGALNGAGKPSDVPNAALGFGWDPPIPSVLVFLDEEELTRIGGARGPLYHVRATVPVEVRAAVTGVATAYSATASAREWTEKALGGLTAARVLHDSPTLIGVKYAVQKAQESPVGLAIQQFLVSYQRRVDDATQWA